MKCLCMCAMGYDAACSWLFETSLGFGSSSSSVTFICLFSYSMLQMWADWPICKALCEAGTCLYFQFYSTCSVSSFGCSLRLNKYGNGFLPWHLWFHKHSTKTVQPSISQATPTSSLVIAALSCAVDSMII